jgi:tripartite-type tricarboxylate transporter receptor subunit TctC
MMGVMFELAAGGKFKIVDVGTNALKVTALVGNQIQASMLNGSLIKGFLESKKFRSLGIMSEKRHPAFPDIPTFKEQGYNLVDDKVYFFAFPKGTPKNIIDTFNAALRKALKDPDTLKKMEENFLLASDLETNKAKDFLVDLQNRYQKVADSVKK